MERAESETVSTEEQPAATIPTVEEYDACKKKLAALQLEAIRTWDRMAQSRLIA